TGRHLIQEEEAKEALLGLYHAEELDKDGFDVYFQGGLRSDDHFNAQETTGYDKIQKNDLWLLSMFDAGQQNGYANMAWLIARWIKRKGAGTQKDSQNYCGQFITKLARKSRVLSDEMLRPPRASMQDLYERIGNMEIRQGTIKRMSYRQSYHWDRYVGVFEHMAGVYSVLLQGAYNPPGYAQPEYDQYYQQYPPQPPHSSSSRMMMSSVEMTQVGCVTACFGSCVFLKQFP
ncbi:hypothetical protein Tco_0030614, partial [Tanacetum coccineum]